MERVQTQRLVGGTAGRLEFQPLELGLPERDPSVGVGGSSTVARAKLSREAASSPWAESASPRT
jgi:hypothetical protein